jgi:chromosome condensin MukBEF complex kleisin-like MukF subunit
MGYGHSDQNIGTKIPEKILDETLIKIIPDIERFYEAFNKVLRHHHYDEEQDYIQYATEAFSDIQTEVKTLMEKDIKGVFDQNMSQEKLYRIKGKLAKNMVIRLKPELKKLAAHSQNLKTRMN